MTEHFCTYFDHRYLPKGLAMWRSLKRNRPTAVLHVLCLSDACHHILEELNLPDIHLHSLPELERADQDLAQARRTRSLVEYYFTLTPCLPLHLFKTFADVEGLTYVDADLFFFADPQPVFDELGNGEVGIIEHRFPSDISNLEKYGRFNVGWLTFRHRPAALECLATWREQCIEWCFDRLEAGRFAEQKYFDEWPTRFQGVHVIQHRGANVAPWNLNRFPVSVEGQTLTVGGDRLLFYHAHGFEVANSGRAGNANLAKYKVQETQLLTTYIFEPYTRAVLAATTEMATPLALVLLADTNSRDALVLLESLKAQVPLLDERLGACEADRAARLEVIHSLEQQVKLSEADRVARIETIRSLEEQLRLSQTDRAASLQVMQSLAERLTTGEADRNAPLEAMQRLAERLTTSEADRAARLQVIYSLESQLKLIEAGRTAQSRLIHELEERLNASEADRAARLDVIHSFDRQLKTIEVALEGTRTELRAALALVHAMEQSRSWRWTRLFR